MANEIAAPVLVSANALRTRRGKFRIPPADLFAGASAALDSAGFVAMIRYGGFPWTVEDYVELAASYPWAWWASMDLCCEPEIATNRIEVARRQIETVRLLESCQKAAKRAGIDPPMPVLQGWHPEDYLKCAEMMPARPWGLVGVGSVCRRPIYGETGLLAVLSALDSGLPADVPLHLFGVKGPALPILARYYPTRIASTDSMAWDFAAARQLPPGESCTLAYRAGHMRRWYKTQSARVTEALGVFG